MNNRDSSVSVPLEYFKQSPVRGQLEPRDETSRDGWRFIQCTETVDELKVLLPPQTVQTYKKLLKAELYELSRGPSCSRERIIEIRKLKDRMIRKCERLVAKRNEELFKYHTHNYYYPHTPLGTAPPMQAPMPIRPNGGLFPSSSIVAAPEDFRLKELDRWLRLEEVFEELERKKQDLLQDRVRRHEIPDPDRKKHHRSKKRVEISEPLVQPEPLIQPEPQVMLEPRFEPARFGMPLKAPTPPLEPLTRGPPAQTYQSQTQFPTPQVVVPSPPQRVRNFPDPTPGPSRPIIINQNTDRLPPTHMQSPSDTQDFFLSQREPEHETISRSQPEPQISRFAYAPPSIQAPTPPPGQIFDPRSSQKGARLSLRTLGSSDSDILVVHAGKDESSSSEDDEYVTKAIPIIPPPGSFNRSGPFSPQRHAREPANMNFAYPSPKKTAV